MKNLSILMLLISFGSIGAVFFTPGLPDIAHYFIISDQTSELTVTYYLVGYTVGQLLYGPMNHSQGSCRTIVIGALLALFGSVLCIVMGLAHSFVGLLIGRLITGIGAGSGLKMTLTLANHIYSKEEAPSKMTLLMMSFAITPGIGVFIGGFLVGSWGWISSFYLMVIYSMIIVGLGHLLPEMYTKEERYPFYIREALSHYAKQFKNRAIVSSGLLVGVCSSTFYIFAALAPFIGMKIMGLSPEAYGSYNLFPVAGMVLGSLIASYGNQLLKPKSASRLGLIILIVGVTILWLALVWWGENPLSLFVPMMLLYLGTSFIFANAISLGLETTSDPSNGSAVISFLNMGSSCVWVFILANMSIHHATALPFVYAILVVLGVMCYNRLIRFNKMLLT